MTMQPDPLAKTMQEAFDEEVAESPDDAALLARAIAGATKRLELGPPPIATNVDAKPEPPKEAAVVRLADHTRVRRRWLRVAIPIAAAFAASIALAFVATRTSTDGAKVSPPVPVMIAPTTTNHGAGPAVPTATPESPPTMSVSDLPNVRPPAAPSASSPMPNVPVASAADLFRDANQERRSGDLTQAIALYRTLLDRYPSSSEAQASHVSLGRLLLDRRGDATGALAEFDAYLAGGATNGTLAEEARLGRALALQKLGRSAEERRAWEELLANHPQSLHAARARERMEALGSP